LFDFVSYGAGKLELFLMVLVRASGLFVFAPIYSQRSVATPIKAGIAILLAGIVMMTLDTTAVPQTGSLVSLVEVLFKELLVGVIIGFVFALLIMAAQGGGAIVGYQVGLAIANELDPITQQQASIIGAFWTVMATLIFLALQGHHMVLEALHQSYEIMPPGQIRLEGPAGEMMIRLTGYVFIIGLKIAAPVMVTLFLVDVALGTLAKMMPTMNVFFVGFPVKVSAGMVIIALSLPVFTYVMKKALVYLNGEMARGLVALAKA
jgi:flagellar biosynthetic protein FliR